ncbi:uncharacterized protein FA14DRAFT_184196 [Meira miltonrushii]|uniref:Uncharacterized protein n=1 Tax=Meira miltonrushii TaxID=1280837 RepID=A0A316VFE3_9BASI|nr:uncharacterized protein FA14DRAFT_184196 [Meira miltonrushii]PWN34741.1 hypothetical protein FA14DRAFT_184196 [Meira miltonrushii]
MTMMSVAGGGRNVKKRVKNELVSLEPQMEWHNIKSVNDKIDRMPIEARTRLSLMTNRDTNDHIRHILQQTKPKYFTAETLHEMHVDENGSPHSKQSLTVEMSNECKGCHRLADQVLARWVKDSRKLIARQSSVTRWMVSVENQTDAEANVHTAERMAIDDATDSSAERSSATVEGANVVDRPLRDPEPSSGTEIAVQTVIQEAEEEVNAISNIAGTKRKRLDDDVQTRNNGENQEREKCHDGFDKCPKCLEKSASLEIQNIILKAQVKQMNNLVSRERHDEDMGKIYKEIGRLHEQMTKAESSSAKQVQELEQYNRMLREQNIVLKQQQQAVNNEFMQVRQAAQMLLRRANVAVEVPSQPQMAVFPDTPSNMDRVPSFVQRGSSAPLSSNVTSSNDQPSSSMPGTFPQPAPFTQQPQQLILAQNSPLPRGGQPTNQQMFLARPNNHQPSFSQLQKHQQQQEQKKLLQEKLLQKMQQRQQQQEHEKLLQQMQQRQQQQARQQHQMQQNKLLLQQAEELLQSDLVQQNASMPVQQQEKSSAPPMMQPTAAQALQQPAKKPTQPGQGVQTELPVDQSPPQLQTAIEIPAAQAQTTQASVSASNPQRRASEGMKKVSLDHEAAELERKHIEAIKRRQSEGGLGEEREFVS